LPGLTFPLWPWPPASWRLDAGVIESRAQGLQQYLKDALREALARGSLPLPLSEFLRLPAEEEEEEEDEGGDVPVTGAGAAGASRFGALLGVLGGGPLPAQQAAAQQAAAEGDSADLEGDCGAGGSQRSSSLLLDLDEEGCAEEPPALLGVGVGDSSSFARGAADNEAAVATALATLQRMRRHLSTLRSLQPRLVRAVAAATPEATSPGGSEAARPYEELESPCQQVKRLDAPLAQVDSLLEALRLQLGGDDALDEELRAHEREREKRLSKLRTATGQQARAAAAGGGGSATFNASGSDGEAGGRATGVLRSWLGRGRA
jgi:hypothetical protein